MEGIMKKPWLGNAVFYEIYPQSFKDTNGDGIGDFRGIIEKLDYVRDLGCNAIWMNPCFESPFGDAGYDVSDYCKAAPRYGTNDDLVRLFAEAHSRGIHVLLDLVPGHTSTEHYWYQQSCRAERNEYTDRYVWTSSVWDEPQKPHMNLLRGHSERDGASVLNFFSFQPALNYGFYRPSEKWQQSVNDEGPAATVRELIRIISFWLDMGCDGFRVDMAFSLVKNDEEEKGTIALWQRIFSEVQKEYPDAVFISEWGNPARSSEAGFDMDFLLHCNDYYLDLFHKENPFFSGQKATEADSFVREYLKQYEQIKGKSYICIPSGNHDMIRMAEYCEPDEIKLAFAFLLTMPGCPFVYYGDEIGMRYVHGLASKEGGYYRTGSRTPMQWSSGRNAGFSDADEASLYLPIDSCPLRPDVESQKRDPDSILSAVRKLTALRSSYSCLQSNADIEFVRGDSSLVYRRFDKSGELTVVINPSASGLEIDDLSGEIVLCIGGTASVADKRLTVPPVSCCIIGNRKE